MVIALVLFVKVPPVIFSGINQKITKTVTFFEKKLNIIVKSFLNFASA